MIPPLKHLLIAACCSIVAPGHARAEDANADVRANLIATYRGLRASLAEPTPATFLTFTTIDAAEFLARTDEMRKTFGSLPVEAQSDLLKHLGAASIAEVDGDRIWARLQSPAFLTQLPAFESIAWRDAIVDATGRTAMLFGTAPQKVLALSFTRGLESRGADTIPRSNPSATTQVRGPWAIVGYAIDEGGNVFRHSIGGASQPPAPPLSPPLVDGKLGLIREPIDASRIDRTFILRGTTIDKTWLVCRSEHLDRVIVIINRGISGVILRMNPTLSMPLELSPTLPADNLLTLQVVGATELSTVECNFERRDARDVKVLPVLLAGFKRTQLHELKDGELQMRFVMETTPTVQP